jgi:hypothetical protein
MLPLSFGRNIRGLANPGASVIFYLFPRRSPSFVFLVVEPLYLSFALPMSAIARFAPPPPRSSQALKNLAETSQSIVERSRPRLRLFFSWLCAPIVNCCCMRLNQR